MKRFELSLLIGIVAAVMLSSLGAFGAECEAVRAEVLRLHVLANSDSDEDQALKLAVRDAVLAATAELFTSSGTKTEIEEVTAEHLDLIERTAQAVVTGAGYDYSVSAGIVNMYFETREYDGTILPAGRYDAVRLTIGTGEGGNWWCVMFPPMCIPAASDDGALAVEEQIEHLQETPRYVPKFAIIEVIELLRGGSAA